MTERMRADIKSAVEDLWRLGIYPSARRIAKCIRKSNTISGEENRFRRNVMQALNIKVWPKNQAKKGDFTL